jgi:tetratricopeptide (TPR) repeat protein
MRLAVLLLAAAPVAVGACATVPACPAQGGPTWRELTTRTITLRTDLDEAEARETIQRLTEIRAALLALFWPAAPEPAFRTNAVVLRSIRELTAFTLDPHAPPEIWGVRTQDPPFEPMIVLGGTDYRSLRVLTAELVYDISMWYAPIQPAWYAAGLAKFLETVSYDRHSGLVEAGAPPDVARVCRTGKIRASRLIDDQFSEDSPDLLAFEARAWLLVHFLVNQRPREFDRLSAALEAATSTQEAWARLFPDLPVERLDEVLDDYAAHGSYVTIRRTITVPPAAVTLREMTDAEVHVVRAQLFRSARAPGVAADPERARRELEEALASEPTNPAAFARQLLWFTPPDQRPGRADAAERIAADHPQDWLAWLTVAFTAGSPARRRTALIRALAIDPNQPAVLNELAALELRDGRFQQALAFATRGMAFRQEVWMLAFTAMRAHRALGHCEDAEALARVLRTRAPTGIRSRVELAAPASTACTPKGAAGTAVGALPSAGGP